MSVIWMNYYDNHLSQGWVWHKPEYAQFSAGTRGENPCWLRVAMYINGHWHRPPVGMRASQASHRWSFRTRFDLFGNPVQDTILVPR